MKTSSSNRDRIARDQENGRDDGSDNSCKDDKGSMTQASPPISMQHNAKALVSNTRSSNCSTSMCRSSQYHTCRGDGGENPYVESAQLANLLLEHGRAMVG